MQLERKKKVSIDDIVDARKKCKNLVTSVVRNHLRSRFAYIIYRFCNRFRAQSYAIITQFNYTTATWDSCNDESRPTNFRAAS